MEIVMERNKTMMQYFEWYLPADKSLWKKAKANAEAIQENGITSVWLPPAYKGASGVSDVGYAVYDLYDLGEFYQKGTVETKYGSKDDYLAAIKALQAAGIEVLADIVLGHRMGADEKERIFAYGDDANNRNIEIEGKKKITVWTKFTFPGRNGKYSDFKWDWTNFHGTDYDAKSQEKGIYRFIGKEWDTEVDGEFGNYDYLMGVDLDMSDPEVLEELDRWGKWYLDFTGVDGFRLDAVKHIEFNFYKVWLRKLRESTGKKLFAVGEYWNAELHILENYIQKTERTVSLFDVPFHFNLHHASKSNGNYDMRYLFKNTLVATDPELAVTFVDNHDTQYGQALESWVLEWFKPAAYALILLREKGYPCVFYGDYYGIPNNNLPPVKELIPLISVRKDQAYGEMHDYFNDRSVVGWTREGVEEMPDSGLAVVLTINEGAQKKMYVGRHFAGLEFYDVLERIEEKVVIDEEGFGVFPVLDGSVSVWIPVKGQTLGERSEEIFHDPRERQAESQVKDEVPRLEEELSKRELAALQEAREKEAAALREKEEREKAALKEKEEQEEKAKAAEQTETTTDTE